MVDLATRPLRPLGRKAPWFDSSRLGLIRYFDLIAAAQAAATIPNSIDLLTGMSTNFGVMLNDRLGDCTCAAVYHARQVWSFNAGGKEITEVDHDVLELYEQACGYNPDVPSSDQGDHNRKGARQERQSFLVVKRNARQTCIGTDHLSGSA